MQALLGVGDQSMTDEDSLNEARKRWKKRFPEIVRRMERLLNGSSLYPDVGTWCTECNRQHAPAVRSEDDE